MTSKFEVNPNDEVIQPTETSGHMCANEQDGMSRINLTLRGLLI